MYAQVHVLVRVCVCVCNWPVINLTTKYICNLTPLYIANDFPGCPMGQFLNFMLVSWRSQDTDSK